MIGVKPSPHLLRQLHLAGAVWVITVQTRNIVRLDRQVIENVGEEDLDPALSTVPVVFSRFAGKQRVQLYVELAHRITVGLTVGTIENAATRSFVNPVPETTLRWRS